MRYRTYLRRKQGRVSQPVLCLPPDMFSFGVTRPGLRYVSRWERRDLRRQYRLSGDDEHWRQIRSRGLTTRLGLDASVRAESLARYKEQ
jgi:hypothetical protein